MNAPLSGNSPGSIWKWAIIALYGAVVLAIVPLHEPWRDEAHTWLIARDLTYGGILQQMHYEGYPPLWFFLQAPLAKGGLPFASLGVLNALCATLAVAVMVFFSPFAFWQKVLIAFSDCLFCWYGMVWRCYSLLVLALFLVAAVYPIRHRRPLLYAGCVVLLANVHVLSLGVALLLFLGFIVGWVRQRPRAILEPDSAGMGQPPAESQSGSKTQSAVANAGPAVSLLACVIMAAGIALLVLVLRQPADCRGPGLFPRFDPKAPFRFLAGAFGRFESDQSLASLPWYLLSFAAFVLLLWDLWRTRAAFWLLLLTFLGWSYVFAFKNPGPSFQHLPALMMMMVAACWIARASNPVAPNLEIRRQPGRFVWHWKLPVRETIVFASLALGLLHVPIWIYKEIRYPFSAGREASQILRNVSLSEPILAYPFPDGESLLPYLPGRKFWSPEMGRFDTFHTPNQQFDACNIHSVETLFRHITAAFPERRPWLVLSAKGRLFGIEEAGYDLVYPTSDPMVWYPLGEEFWIYRPKQILTPSRIPRSS